MIVIDVGCARYGGDYSIERLIEEFEPDVMYGFDPNPSVEEGMYRQGGVTVTIMRKAAWVYDGEIGYLEDGLNSTLTARTDVTMVPCIDLAQFIIQCAGESDGDIVLKIDAEGAEYELLEHLIDTDADSLLKLAWVEWHPKKMENGEQRRRNIEAAIRCELTEWLW